VKGSLSAENREAITSKSIGRGNITEKEKVEGKRERKRKGVPS
jgi:hypothetical protein